MKKFRPGDKVIKNKDTWVATEFDLWGRGIGIGVVVEPPFPMGSSDCDVKWKGGRCFEDISQLLHHERKITRIARKFKIWIWKFLKG